MIEHLEYENLEKEFHIKKLASTSGSPRGRASPKTIPSPTTPFSPPPMMKLDSFSKSTSQMTSIDRRLTMESPAAKQATSKKENVTSLISSWFGDAESAIKDGNEVGKDESKVIESAVLDAAKRAENEAEENKKNLKLKGEQERAKFMKAAKSLKKGPGKMVVALTKSENEVSFLNEKVKMLEERDVETRALLERAEETMVGMVGNVEREAIRVLEMNFQGGAWKSGDDRWGTRALTSSSNQEWEERCSQLEMQKDALLDLLRLYDGSDDVDLAALPEDIARLAVYKCGQEVVLREGLCRTLGIAGEIKDKDILGEVEVLVKEATDLRGQVETWRRKEEEGKIIVGGVGQVDPLLQNEAVHEIVVAKEVQTKHARSRQHSAALSDAKLAAAIAEVGGGVVHPPSPTLVEDLDLVSSIQDERFRNRKHTVNHSKAKEALEAVEKYEEMVETEKAKEMRRLKRTHTVGHRDAGVAFDAFEGEEKAKAAELEGAEGGDVDDEDEYEYDEYESEGEEEEEEGEGKGDQEGRWSPTIASEEVHYADMKLLLHQQKMFSDPLGNDINLLMSTYKLPEADSNGYSRFRIKAYDGEIGRDLCMDINEVDLRNR